MDVHNEAGFEVMINNGLEPPGIEHVEFQRSYSQVVRVEVEGDEQEQRNYNFPVNHKLMIYDK